MTPLTGNLSELLKTIEGAERLLILTHKNPDPDAMASAFGLRHILNYYLKTHVYIAYGGTIGRSENLAMIKLLRIPLHEISPGRISRFKHIALVDAQPGAKNTLAMNSLHSMIVIDHHLAHRQDKKLGKSYFQDLRPEYGATSTIIAEYIKENEIPLNARVATALYYGIKTDIGDRGREHTDYDIKMLQFLFPKTSLKWLWRIENAPVPANYFMHYADAINNAIVTGDVILSDLGEVTAADAVAEMADFLLKLKGMRWSMCLGNQATQLNFSIRTTRKGRKIGALAYRLAGRKGSAGGHEQSAAGWIPIGGLNDEDLLQVRRDLAERFCKLVGSDYATGTRLLEKSLEKATS